jgi:hypothetical protein
VRWTGLLGLILLVAWLVTADWYGRPLLGPRNDGDGVAENDPLWTYGKLVRFVFEFMGRTFCATLCFADLFLRASIAHWHAEAINRQRRARQRSVMALSLRASVANIITYSDHRDAKYADMQRELQSQQRNTGSSNVTSEAVFDPDEDKDERTNNDDNDSDPTHQHNATKTAGGKSKEMDKTWPSPHSLDSPSKEEDVHA